MLTRRFSTGFARQADPSRAPARVQCDAWLRMQIRRVWEESFQLYGIRKVWHQLRREGIRVARCTVERLMRALGIEGVRRGQPVKTTVADKARPCPLDRVNRQFSADSPDQLWVSDFTHVKTQRGMTYVAFVTDVFSRHIVGWKVSTTPRTDFVLDALEQALYARRPGAHLVHHSDRGSQYLSIRYTRRLEEAGIEPSVGSVGDSYDNALAEAINGLFKAGVIHRRSWKRPEEVKLATLTWVSWFNNVRLLEPIGHVPPVEAEKDCYRQTEGLAKVA